MTNPSKIDIRSLRLEELTARLAEWGEPAYRARQVYEWLWNKGATQISDMTNLSLALRNRLEEHFEIRNVKVQHSQFSKDGTIKKGSKLF